MEKLAIDGGEPAAREPIPGARVEVTPEDISAVTEVLKSGNLRQGKVCRAFEEAFAAKVGAGYATTIANGTAALHAAYAALTEPGDEVLVPAVTFFATASMVAWAGAKPVFCDIDPETFTLDVEDARRRVTPKTRAVAGVHLFGNCCPMDETLEMAREYDLRVVWDAAQAHLTTYKGRDVGSFGDAVTYSFYATKNMTTGEGGMVTSPHKWLIEKIILMKEQGQSGKYRHTVLGGNYRMTDVEAALGLSQLSRLGELTARRREIAAFYDEALGSLGGVRVPVVKEGVEHCYHLYTVVLDLEAITCDRDTFVKRLGAENIGARVNYPGPLHLQDAFRNVSEPVELPNAEAYCRACLSLPVYPQLTDRETNRVAQGFKKVLRHSLR